jgi:hypothetical protein
VELQEDAPHDQNLGSEVIRTPMGRDHSQAESACEKMTTESDLSGADAIMPAKMVMVLGSDVSRSPICERRRAQPESQLQVGAEEEEELVAGRRRMTMASVGPPVCEPPKEVVQDMWSRFERFRDEPDGVMPQRVADDMLFEELQSKWRDLRGGMTVKDLRPEFKALLEPLKLEVTFGSVRKYAAPYSHMSLLGSQLPQLLPETASGVHEKPSGAEPQSVAMAHAVPGSKPKDASALSLPSLKQNEKERPTLGQLPKDRQRENCVQQ